MILREIKLILVIAALCLVATFGITASNANLTGAVGRVTPLLIVIALMIVAILLLEALTQKVEVPTPISVIFAIGRENMVGSLTPAAAAAAMGAILSLYPLSGSAALQSVGNASSKSNIVHNQCSHVATNMSRLG